MTKRKYITNSIFFYAGVVLVFGIISVFMYFANCYWYAYLIPFSAAIFLLSIRHTILWRRLIRGLYYLIAVIVSLMSLYFVRPESNVSLSSVIVRESIGALINSPKSEETALIDKLKSFIQNASFWRPPKGYELEKIDVDGLPIEVLKKRDTDSENAILHLHGGAYVIKYIDVYRRVAYKYSSISGGADIVSIDYKVAPEYTYPAALNDALLAWDWMLEQGYSPDNIIIAGDSAGGNLALALTAKLRDEERELPRALVLMSPWTDLAGEGESRQYNQDKDPIFGGRNGIVNNFDKKSNPYAKDADLFDKYLSPVYGEFNDFPPMLIQVGTYEILESDSIDVYTKAREVGVDATLTQYHGMFHSFQLAGSLLPESRKAWQEAERFIKRNFSS